ncbi:MAG TPA: purine-nucleoside phosphorylase [Lacipirellulaceae bacterium]|jgi:purine-nucleoside phosphorylase|nr:purine-nucleoside phosphorylase [Lacipirellulaceae bacterium]
MQHLRAQIAESAEYIRTRWSAQPRCGIILGSGLGSVGESIELEMAIEYGDIPNFLKSTAVGHKGRLLCGKLAGVPVVAMQGRFHCYEGYSAERATFPVRVMNALGIELLIVSNAAGGLNPNFACGDVMVIDDHINLLNRNPLVGVNDDELGPRFPDMGAPYDRRLGDLVLAIARKHDFVCHRGVYAAMLGPTYETRAEIRMARYFDADAVGMSTVPEAIVAIHAGLRVLGLSTITNICSPDKQVTTSGHEVIATAETAREKLLAIVNEVISHEFGPCEVNNK